MEKTEKKLFLVFSQWWKNNNMQIQINK